jgi:NitT/TauT family transport system permease protein
VTGPDRSPRGSRARLRLLSAAGVVILLAGWAVVSLAVSSFFVPAPWETIADAARLLARASTWTQIGITLLRICVGFIAGYLAGLAAGLAMGAGKGTAALFQPLVLFFQGMPPLLWAIPLVALMGIGHVPTIVVIALITFPLVAVTIGEGMSTLPRDLREMLRIYAPGLRPRLQELTLPHLAPFLAASLNAGLVLAVKASVTAEYFGANNGIGFQIQSAYNLLAIHSLFAWAAVLILVILLFNTLLPRLRTAWPSIRRRLSSPGPISCSLEDIRELKAMFTSLGGSPRVGLSGVGFSYRRHKPLLSGITMEVPPHEIAVVTGESGIGKTTLLKLVASLISPTEGSIERPARISYVFQDERLLPWRTVAENTALPLLYQGIPRKNAFCFACYLLSEAGLGGEEEKRPAELSGGMKKRAALARCFARLPDAILMDEPFTGLHAEARSHLWSMFLRLHALHPVPTLVVTHFPEEIVSQGSCRLYTLQGSPARLAGSCAGTDAG